VDADFFVDTRIFENAHHSKSVATMALDPQSEESHTYPLNDNLLVPLQPSCCVGIPGRVKAFLHCGEFVVLREPLAINAAVDGDPVTLHAKVGRILRITPIGGDSLRILLSLLFCASEFPSPRIRDKAAPPDRRQYVEYPTHVVSSNIVKWVPGSSILSEAFVFTEEDLNDGTGAYAVGMENAFHARYQWEKDGPIFYPIGPETLPSFPYNDCYSRRNWDLLVRVSTLINRELTRSFIAQHTSKNVQLFLTRAEFDYLKDRMMPDIEAYTKHGVTTNIQPRKCATREGIKQRVAKEYLRVDTGQKFSKLQAVLGSAIVLGLRARPPRVPSLRVADQYKWSFVVAGRHDTVNLFFPLPAESLDGMSHRAHRRGIDFMYDPSPKPEGRLSLRFRRSDLSDPVVRQVLNLEPLDNANDSGSSSDDNGIEIVKGTLLGDDFAVYRVRRVLTNETHVAVIVVESQDHDLVVGTERIFTIEYTRVLYRQYN
jgi:hypothetical protein